MLLRTSSPHGSIVRTPRDGRREAMFRPTRHEEGERGAWPLDAGILLRDFFDEAGGLRFPLRLDEAQGLIPRCDIHEESGAYVVDAELPGVKQEEIEIRAHGHELEIEGERRVESRGDRKCRCREIRAGRFYRRVHFAEEIDPARTEASLVDGVLTVRLPHKAAAARTRIPIVKRRG
jgi:HSP20 family molecular chaperone IbpA